MAATVWKTKNQVVLDSTDTCPHCGHLVSYHTSQGKPECTATLTTGNAKRCACVMQNKH